MILLYLTYFWLFFLVLIFFLSIPEGLNVCRKHSIMNVRPQSGSNFFLLWMFYKHITSPRLRDDFIVFDLFLVVFLVLIFFLSIPEGLNVCRKHSIMNVRPHSGSNKLGWCSFYKHATSLRSFSFGTVYLCSSIHSKRYSLLNSISKFFKNVRYSSLKLCFL